MNELVFLDSDNQIMTTSLTIAEVFEKEHKDVLRVIRDQIAVLPEEFCRRNFALTSTEVAQPNGGVRSVPMYNLTRDGFSLIVMGFTGEKALQWKVKYIEAFNVMEAELLKQKEQVVKPAPSSLADRTPLLIAIFQAAKIEGNQLALALDKIHIRESGYSALKTSETQLIAPQQQQLYIPTELGESIEPPLKPRAVNKLLEEMGWQVKGPRDWEAVGDGVAHAVYIDTGKVHTSDGTPVRQLKWTADVIFALQAYVNSKHQIEAEE